MDLREIVWEGVNWINLSLDRDHWRALVNAIMNQNVCISHLSHPCYMFRPSHPIWFVHRNNIWGSRLYQTVFKCMLPGGYPLYKPKRCATVWDRMENFLTWIIQSLANFDSFCYDGSKRLAVEEEIGVGGETGGRFACVTSLQRLEG
jgi:hypothetical protein